MLSPTIDKIAARFAGKVKVIRLDVDQRPDVAARYRVASVPQLLIFLGGNEPRERLVGMRSEAEIASQDRFSYFVTLT